MQTPSHVLIIDQDVAARQDIAAMLPSEKCRLSEARDGREALSRIHAPTRCRK